MSRGWLRVLLAVAAALLLALPAGPARAHAELVSSDPADGATLESPPDELRFTFGEELLPQGNAITAFAVAADERVPLPQVAVAGNAVSVAWPQSRAAGEYRASYRVVSADGHPISGSITFTITAGGPAAATASGASGDPGNDASATASPATPGDEAPTSLKEPARAGVLIWVLGIGVLGLVVASAAMWFTRRSRGL
ncbi:MAG: copper resistance CopC family protein [Candidatus Nanopelagicales bacterium]